VDYIDGHIEIRKRFWGGVSTVTRATIA
jgi:hypothetical protein